MNREKQLTVVAGWHRLLLLLATLPLLWLLLLLLLVLALPITVAGPADRLDSFTVTHIFGFFTWVHFGTREEILVG